MAGELEPGTVHSLAGHVDYQNGGIVSRTLMSGVSGSTTLFAFDEGQRLSEHTVPHDALVFVLEGTAEITIAGNANRVSSGETILMPGGHPHAVSAPERFKMLLVMLRRREGGE